MLKLVISRWFQYSPSMSRVRSTYSKTVQAYMNISCVQIIFWIVLTVKNLFLTSVLMHIKHVRTECTFMKLYNLMLVSQTHGFLQRIPTYVDHFCSERAEERMLLNILYWLAPLTLYWYNLSIPVNALSLIVRDLPKVHSLNLSLDTLRVYILFRIWKFIPAATCAYTSRPLTNIYLNVSAFLWIILSFIHLSQTLVEPTVIMTNVNH